MRLVTFIIALLLLAGSVDPTRGWLIALVVVSGLAAIRWRTWAPFSFRPAIDLRLAMFVIAVLLLAGTIDPTRDWLIVLPARKWSFFPEGSGCVCVGCSPGANR